MKKLLITITVMFSISILIYGMYFTAYKNVNPNIHGELKTYSEFHIDIYKGTLRFFTYLR